MRNQADTRLDPFDRYPYNLLMRPLNENHVEETWLGRFARKLKLFPGSSPTRPPPAAKSVLVLTHRQDPNGHRVASNIAKSFDYAGMFATFFDLETRLPWPRLDEFRTVVVATTWADSVSDQQHEQLSAFIASGGGLVAAMIPNQKRFLELFGTLGEPPAAQNRESITLRFETDLFPGIQGFDCPIECDTHEPFLRELSPVPHATIVAQDITHHQPVAWRHSYGAGQIFVWNTTLVYQRIFRGLLLQSILSVRHIGVMKIANAAVLQVDDFPAGYADLDREPVRSEFNMKFTRFLTEVWLPDILQISREFNLPFDFFIPFAYNDVTSPPFDFKEWKALKAGPQHPDKPLPVHWCEQISQHGGGLALHGYNHQPLTLSCWSSRKNMRKGLRAAMQQWKRDKLGSPPVVYAPPMNQYDCDGAHALTEAIPSLKIICGSYEEILPDGKAREFGPEPWNTALFALPRVTYGYEMTPFQRLVMVSHIALMGVWTNFFHPDDVMDIPENNPALDYHRNANRKDWRKDGADQSPSMLNTFRNWLIFARNTYPWLRYVHTTEAAAYLQSYLAKHLTVTYDENAVELVAGAGTEVLVRLEGDPTAITVHCDGAKILHQHKTENVTLCILRMMTDRARVTMVQERGRTHDN